jgi:hypothetical protein
MRLKVVIVDLEIPPRVKRWSLRIGLPIAILAAAGVALADLPVKYTVGQKLTPNDLTDNFNYLQNEIATLQAQITTPTFGSRTPSAFHAWLTNTVSVEDEVITPVVFDHVDYDLANEYDFTTGVFKPQAAGIHLIHCAISYTSAPGFYAAAVILRNGGQASVTGGSGPTDVATQTTNTLQLAKGDSVTCSSFQISGASQSPDTAPTGNNNTFTATRLY